MITSRQEKRHRGNKSDAMESLTRSLRALNSIRRERAVHHIFPFRIIHRRSLWRYVTQIASRMNIAFLQFARAIQEITAVPPRAQPPLALPSARSWGRTKLQPRRCSCAVSKDLSANAIWFRRSFVANEGSHANSTGLCNSMTSVSRNFRPRSLAREKRDSLQDRAESHSSRQSEQRAARFSSSFIVGPLSLSLLLSLESASNSRATIALIN